MGTRQYDVLRDTWIYQEIKELVQAELHEQELLALRQALYAIVQARFPRLEARSRQIGEAMTECASLRQFLIKIGTARTEKEARECLNARGSYGSAEGD